MSKVQIKIKETANTAGKADLKDRVWMIDFTMKLWDGPTIKSYVAWERLPAKKPLGAQQIVMKNFIDEEGLKKGEAFKVYRVSSGAGAAPNEDCSCFRFCNVAPTLKDHVAGFQGDIDKALHCPGKPLRTRRASFMETMQHCAECGELP